MRVLNKKKKKNVHRSVNKLFYFNALMFVLLHTTAEKSQRFFFKREIEQGVFHVMISLLFEPFIQ